MDIKDTIDKSRNPANIPEKKQQENPFDDVPFCMDDPCRCVVEQSYSLKEGIMNERTANNETLAQETIITAKIIEQPHLMACSMGKHGKRNFLLETRYKDELGKSKGYIPVGVPGMIAAAGGTGKSMILMQLAFSVASGDDWFGFKVAKPGKVLMLMGELEDCDLEERLEAMLNKAALPCPQKALNNIIPVCLGGFHGLDFVHDREARIRHKLPFETAIYNAVLKRLKKDGPYALVIIDPVSRFGGRDFEIDNSSATCLVELLEKLGQAEGNPAIVIAHHTSKASSKGKTDQTAARGSSSLTDGVKWQINLERLPRRDKAPNLLVARFVKTNYGADRSALVLSRDQDGLLDIATKEERNDYLKAKPARDDSFFTLLKRKVKAEAEDEDMDADEGEEKNEQAVKPSQSDIDLMDEL